MDAKKFIIKIVFVLYYSFYCTIVFFVKINFFLTTDKNMNRGPVWWYERSFIQTLALSVKKKQHSLIIRFNLALETQIVKIEEDKKKWQGQKLFVDWHIYPKPASSKKPWGVSSW